MRGGCGRIGKDPRNIIHVRNNQDVCDLLVKRGIRPETLPSKEDLKKLERRVREQEKHLPERAGKINSRQEHEKTGDTVP